MGTNRPQKYGLEGKKPEEFFGCGYQVFVTLRELNLKK